MKLSNSVPLILALLATPIAAQSAAALKKELKKMESAAKKDPEALFAAGKWASEKNLKKDAKRVFQKVLKLDSNHSGANRAIGNEEFDGKWWPAKKAKALREKALDAEFSAKGYKKIDGVWVPADEVKDARKGIFKHDGELVSRNEKVALQEGKVRHPVTGQLIAATDLEKAQNGYFPLANDKWGDQKDANQFHSELGRPWIIRTDSAQIMSTLPIEKIEDLKKHVEQGIEKVSPLFGSREITPDKRPLIIIAKTQSEYTNLGNNLGDGTDVAGAFLISEEAEFRIPGQGIIRPAICENHKDWGVRYIRHAAAIAYINAISEEAGADLPLWFVHSVGSYTSRFENDYDAGHFSKAHIARGGVTSPKSFMSGFALNGDMTSSQIAFNIFQAGLFLSYATRGGNQEVTDAMVALTDTLSGKAKGSASKAIIKLEKLLADNKDGITEHLKKLAAKGP